MSYKIPKQLDLYADDTLTGRECELCHYQEKKYFPCVLFHLDLDPSNQDATNTALVCPRCYRHLALAMPDGIAQTRTLFAFLINRGVYTHEQLTNPDQLGEFHPPAKSERQLDLF